MSSSSRSFSCGVLMYAQNEMNLLTPFSNFFPSERIHVHSTITPHPIVTWSQPNPDSFKMRRKKIRSVFYDKQFKTFSTVMFMKNVFLPILFPLGESNNIAYEYEYESNLRIGFCCCLLSVYSSE